MIRRKPSVVEFLGRPFVGNTAVNGDQRRLSADLCDAAPRDLVGSPKAESAIIFVRKDCQDVLALRALKLSYFAKSVVSAEKIFDGIHAAVPGYHLIIIGDGERWVFAGVQELKRKMQFNGLISDNKRFYFYYFWTQPRSQIGDSANWR